MKPIKAILAFALLLFFTPLQAHANSKQIQVSEKFEPAVVKIEILKRGDVSSFGSGFFISDDGKILTNKHVVEDGLTGGSYSVRVKTRDGLVFNTVELLKCGDSRHLDLCLVKIDYKPKSFFRVTDFNTKKGTDVLVLGHPRGYEYTLSTGIISGFYKESNCEHQKDFPIDYVQMTAPTSPGNSGGPVFDEDGNLIGVSTWIRTDKGSQNLNFAVAASEVTRFVSGDFKPVALNSGKAAPDAEKGEFNLTVKLTDLTEKFKEINKSLDESISLLKKTRLENTASLSTVFDGNKYVLAIPAPFNSVQDCKWSDLPNGRTLFCKSKAEEMTLGVTLMKGKENTVDNIEQVYHVEPQPLPIVQELKNKGTWESVKATMPPEKFKYLFSVPEPWSCKKETVSDFYFKERSTSCSRSIQNDGAAGTVTKTQVVQKKDDPYLVSVSVRMVDAPKKPESFFRIPASVVGSIQVTPAP